uniref:Uncharacterized protein n=1 Tax=Fagus sylvatica TaxID=28930 RepID=A0A2N9GF85_FAGSY
MQFHSLLLSPSANNFYHLSSNNFVEAVEYHPLVPDLAISHEQAPVLALQVTTFSNCGLCIGITTHHAVLDGKSSTMFMKSWAHLCKNALSSSLVPDLTPSFDRMVIKDPSRLETIYLNQWLNLDGPHNRSLKVWDLKTPPDVVRGTFELTRTNLEKLRQLITNMLEEKNEQQQPSSSLVKVNTNMGLHMVAERNDLLGGKGCGCGCKGYKRCDKKATGIAGSPRFELYNTDFGWGKPMKVEMISIDRTGAISVSDTRDGAGGIKVGLVLKKHEMKVFASIYAKGLEVL